MLISASLASYVPHVVYTMLPASRVLPGWHSWATQGSLHPAYSISMAACSTTRTAPLNHGTLPSQCNWLPTCGRGAYFNHTTAHPGSLFTFGQMVQCCLATQQYASSAHFGCSFAMPGFQCLPAHWTYAQMQTHSARCCHMACDTDTRMLANQQHFTAFACAAARAKQKLDQARQITYNPHQTAYNLPTRQCDNCNSLLAWPCPVH
jgi:hypothetical protein